MTKKRKKSVIVIETIIIALAVTAIGFIVYAALKQHDDDMAVNKFVPADVKIAVQENDGDNSEETPEFENEITWTPEGDTYKAVKQVCVKNLSGDKNNADAYIRVCLISRWKIQVRVESNISENNEATADYSGYTLNAFPETISNNSLVMGVTGDDNINRTVTFTLASDWNDNWIYKDGYFYCKSVIEPDEETPLLLESVSVDKDFFTEFTSKYGCDFQVDVIADSIQANGGAVDVRWSESGIQINSDTKNLETKS